MNANHNLHLISFQTRFGVDFYMSHLGHDLLPAGHRADASPAPSTLLLPGLDVLGAPSGV